MNQRFFLCCTTLSASLVAAMIGACGGGDNTNGDSGPDSTTGADTGGNDTGQNDVANDTGQGNEAGNDAGGCDAGCYACCAAEDPAAATKLFEAARNCACMPANCRTECNTTLCGTTAKQPDKACIACILSVDAGDCAQTAVASCADAGCGPVATCMEACP